MLCNQKISETDKKLWQVASFSPLFFFRNSELFIHKILLLLPLKRDLYTVSDSSEQIVINFVYLKLMFREHVNQGWETWIVREVTKHFIHYKNVKNFHFSNKATENYQSLNNGAASVRPHLSPHFIQ